MQESSSPWRQPIVWLMVVLVGAVVLGSIWMLIVAGGSESIDSVPDRVQRTGQAQVADLDPDARAAAAGLGAILRIDADAGFIEVLPVNGSFDHAAPLELALHHPTRAADDRRLVLAPHADGWRIDTQLDGAHDWLLQLQPADGRWRMRGRLPKGQLAAQIRPALGGEGD